MSGPGDWIATVVGVGLLLLLAWDVFATAFHPTGRGGPLSRTMNRLLWRAIRRAGWGGGGPRPGILELGGPLMALATIVMWATLLVVGHAVLYLPHMADFHYGTGSFGSAVQEAFSYSGIVASTLGLGDVVPPDGPLRLLTVTQALGGFGLLTVSVSYVLAVYRELIQARGLAGAIDVYHPGEPPAPGEAVGPEALEDRRVELASRLLQVSEGQHQYPILHYFRPADLRHALPVQLDRLLRLYEHEAEARRRGAGEAPPGPDGDELPHTPLRRALAVYLDEVHDLFVPGRPGGNGGMDEREDGMDRGDGGLERMREQLDDLLVWLRYPSRSNREPGGSGREPAAAGGGSADGEARWS